MIDPGGIPQIDADLDALSAAGAQLKTEGGAVRDTGADVHATWQGLSAVYEAPEAGQLLAATAPVRTASDQVGSRLERVGAALVAYAEEVRPIQAELARLRGAASAFVAAADADEDWRKDAGKVEEHSGLLSAVGAARAAFEQAERRCASAISAVDGGVQFVADNGDGITQVGEYGYDADTWQAAATSEDGAGWGTPEERDYPFWEDIGRGAVSLGKGLVVDSIGGAAKDILTLVNPASEDFGTAWKGLGSFAVAITIVPTIINERTALPGFKRGQLGDTLQDAAKGIVAWETWKEDPARAAGATLGNLVMAVVGTKGAGGAAKSGATAARGAARRLPTTAQLKEAVKARLAVTPALKIPEFKVPGVVQALAGVGPPGRRHQFDVVHPSDVRTMKNEAHGVEGPGPGDTAPGAGAESSGSTSRPADAPETGTPARIDESVYRYTFPNEQATAERLAAHPSVSGRTLRSPTEDVGYEYIDDLGRTYDAVGDGSRFPEKQNMQDVCRSIDRHLLKQNEFTVIDMTGYSSGQAAVVRCHVDGLPTSLQAKIIRLGF